MALLTGDVLIGRMRSALRRVDVWWTTCVRQRFSSELQVSCVIKEKVGVRSCGTDPGTFWTGVEHPQDTILLFPHPGSQYHAVIYSLHLLIRQ